MDELCSAFTWHFQLENGVGNAIGKFWLPEGPVQFQHAMTIGIAVKIMIVQDTSTVNYVLHQSYTEDY